MGDLVLVSLLLTVKYFTPCFRVSIVNFEQVNAGWVLMDPVGIYPLTVNNRDTRRKCKICSKLTIKTPKRCHWLRSDVFIVKSEHISHFVQVFLLLTLNM